MGDLSQIMDAFARGDPQPAGALLPQVYDELRRLAAQRLAHEEPGQTLEPTALVHEAYLRLVGDDPGRPWDNRGHFFAAAAEAVRRILVERARQKRRLKRGGGRARVVAAFDGTGRGHVAVEVWADLTAAGTRMGGRKSQIRVISGRNDAAT